MNKYYDLSHAQMRLESSVVKLDDRFVFINGVGKGSSIRDGYKIVYTSLSDPNKEQFVGFIPQQVVDCSDLRLGFVNLEGSKSCVFASRVPIRAYKEGLTNTNVSVLDPTKYVGAFGSAAIGRLIVLPEFDKTLKGIYPSYDECFRATKKLQAHSMAFGRSFAVDKKGNLFFRSLGIVGICNKEPLLKDKYSYLKELLEGELH